MAELKDIAALLSELCVTLKNLDANSSSSDNNETTQHATAPQAQELEKAIHLNHEALKRVMSITESVELVLGCIEYAHGIAELVEGSVGTELFHTRQKIVIDALATFTLDSRNILKKMLGYT